MRPRPQRGLGWRKGGDKFPKNRFSTEQIFATQAMDKKVRAFFQYRKSPVTGYPGSPGVPQNRE
jgi:hypothetical protein